MVYGISSGALRAAAVRASAIPSACAQLALDAHVWTGEGEPDACEQRKKKLPEYLKTKRRPINRAFVRSIFERDHPGTADDKIIKAFADRILELDDRSRTAPTSTCATPARYVDPTQITSDDHHARRIRRHRRLPDLDQRSMNCCPIRTSSSQ